MKHIPFLISLLGISVIIPNLVMAEQQPKAGQLDARIRTVAYQENDVVAVQSHYGISTLVVFADEEIIETITLGDTQSWLVEPNARQNMVFLKPIEPDAASNMNIVTNRRIYNFALNKRNRLLPCALPIQMMRLIKDSGIKQRRQLPIPILLVSMVKKPTIVMPIREMAGCALLPPLMTGKRLTSNSKVQSPLFLSLATKEKKGSSISAVARTSSLLTEFMLNSPCAAAGKPPACLI